MGRSPCCSKIGMNRGAWTSVEDKILTAFIEAHGEGNWRSLPKRAGLKRCGKSCRLRWMNYLRPDIKRGNISRDEEDLIIRLHKLLGNRWSLIAGRLPGRTDNEIKNYWNTTLCKRIGAKPTTRRPLKQTAPRNKRVPNHKRKTNLNHPTLGPASSLNDQVVNIMPIRTKASRCTRVIANIFAMQQQQTPNINNNIQLQLQQSSHGNLDTVHEGDQPSHHLIYTFSSSTTLSSFLMEEEGDGHYQDQKKDNNDSLVLNNNNNNNNDDWCTQGFGNEPGLESWVMDNGVGDDVGLDLDSLISFLNQEE